MVQHLNNYISMKSYMYESLWSIKIPPLVMSILQVILLLTCLLFSISVSIMFQRRPLVTETRTFIVWHCSLFSSQNLILASLLQLTLVTGTKACLSFPTLNLTPVNRVHALRAQSSHQQTVLAGSSFPCSGAQGIN